MVPDDLNDWGFYCLTPHSALESLVVGKKFVDYVTITQSFGIAQGSKWAQKQNFLTRAFWVIAILRFSLT